jgi:NADPH-dependent 2,4-dienoyl-CoA reductase/sulfur reductase-like enzyme
MRHESCDILVVGGGPAGMAAACSAAEAKASVLLVDDNPGLGGQIWRGLENSGPESKWSRRLAASGAQAATGTRVLASAGRNAILAERHGEPLRIQWRKLVLATGARELLLPFPGWTLPGVTGAGGLQALAQGGWPVRGKRVVVAGSGPLLLAVAAHLRARGARIQAIAEQAEFGALARFAAGLVPSPRKLYQAIHLGASLHGIRLLTGTWPVRAEGVGRLESVVLRTPRGTRRFECDFLACGFGLAPNIELAVLLDCRLNAGFVAVDEWQRTTVEDVLCAGEPTGIGGLERSLIEGRISGLTAAGATSMARGLFAARARARRFSARLERTFALRNELRSVCSQETIVCRCEDVRLGSLAKYADPRSAKLHTRYGMGPCQGRVCGAAAHFLLGWDPLAGSGRPPVFPASLSTLAAMTAGEGEDGAPD